MGKLGHLFTAGRKRNARNGTEGPSGSSAKPASPRDATSSQLPDREGGRGEPQGPLPGRTDGCEEGLAREEPGAPEGERSQAVCQAAPASSRAAAAGQPCHAGDSRQLEPLDAEGEPSPDATTAAKQLHSSLENSPRREDASPGAAWDPETAQRAGGAPGSPTRERPAGGLGEAADGVSRAGAEGSEEPQGAPPEDASAPPGDPLAEGAENRVGSAQVNGRAAPGGRGSRQGERAHPAKVLTLDIYLSKTEDAQGDEPAVVSPGAEDYDDQDDMDRRAGGRRPGRRRRSQKSTDSPGPDAALPDGAARDDAVFDYEVAPDAATGTVSAEKKVKSARAAPDGGVASAASAESKSSPGCKGQPRGESERGKQPPPAASPTKKRGKIRVPEAVPSPPAGSPRAPAKESPPKRGAAPDSKAAAADSAEEAPRAVPRELTVKSSSLLPEIKPEHKRGPLPPHWDGRGERSKEPGRSAGGPDADGLRPRNHFGAGRSTVTTKVTL